MIYIRDLNQGEVLHFSLENVESAEEWILSILRAMKGKSLQKPFTPLSSSSDDSILSLLSEFDTCVPSYPHSPLKTPSLVDNHSLLEFR